MHFDATGMGGFGPNTLYVACGAKVSAAQLTKNAREVTCERCKYSAVYRAAMSTMEMDVSAQGEMEDDMSMTRICCNFCGFPQVYCKCGPDVKPFPVMVEPFNPPKGSFQAELETLINQHSIEGGSNTPDFILACFLRQCLEAFDMATRRRDEHSRR